MKWCWWNWDDERWNITKDELKRVVAGKDTNKDRHIHKKAHSCTPNETTQDILLGKILQMSQTVNSIEAQVSSFPVNMCVVPVGSIDIYHANCLPEVCLFLQE